MTTILYHHMLGLNT